jgi:hypothetical protein
MTPQDTPDIQGLRDFQFASDPSSPFRFARAKQDLERVSSNPYGAYTTPAVRDAQMKTGIMNLTQQEGQTSAEENANLNNMKYAQKSGLASLTAPQLVNTGNSYSGTQSGSSSGMSTGTGTGTSQQSGGLGQMLLGSVLQGAVGNPALM